MYSDDDLKQLHGAGKAYRTKRGQMIPTATAGDLAEAVARAKEAQGTGLEEDDEGLRSHLAARAAARGARALVPAGWAASGTQAAKGTQWSDARFNSELTAAMSSVAKAANVRLGAVSVEYTSPPERADALAKAADYRRTARFMSDLAEADAYERLARRTLAEAGLPA